MTLLEMKTKVLALIEEISPNNAALTDDPDIAAKINGVINQVMFEVCRMKKIPRYIELEVREGETLDFAALERESGYTVYQIDTVSGVGYRSRAGGTVLKFEEDGTAEIDLFVYPERITDTTKDKAYEFELSDDALEVMVYGVAADLLKSDVSANYGQIYSQRYETMLQRLDSRYSMGSISVEGGFTV